MYRLVSMRRIETGATVKSACYSFPSSFLFSKHRIYLNTKRYTCFDDVIICFTGIFHSKIRRGAKRLGLRLGDMLVVCLVLPFSWSCQTVNKNSFRSKVHDEFVTTENVIESSSAHPRATAQRPWVMTNSTVAPRYAVLRKVGKGASQDRWYATPTVTTDRKRRRHRRALWRGLGRDALMQIDV